MNKFKSQLRLKNLQIPMRIGVSDSERSVPQKITINIAISFNQPPPGCLSDKIEETVCYESLCKNITNFCQQNSFCLLEHLGHRLCRYLKEDIKFPGSLQLDISKASPLPNLESSHFCIETEIGGN